MANALSRRALLAWNTAVAIAALGATRTIGAPMTPRPGLPPTEKMHLVLKAWDLARDLNYFYPVPPVPSDVIAQAEAALGYLLPESMRTLYMVHNGGGYLGGNVNQWPLLPTDDNPLAIMTGTQQLREWQWDLPPELLVFGDDGSDGTFGLWMDKRTQPEPFVVEVDGTGGAFAIVGDDLASFLLGRSAYYLMLYSDYFDPDRALDVLEVPEYLRRNDFDDEHYYDIQRWANPGLPDVDPNSRDVWWTPQQIQEYLVQLASRLQPTSEAEPGT